jgi:1,4-alpha-glucan branching enzyme
VRRDEAGASAIVAANMTPVPRPGYRLGVPAGVLAWREVLNTDSAYYGGSNVGNGAGPLAVQDVPAHGRAQSIELTLPPLATVFLQPC